MVDPGTGPERGCRRPDVAALRRRRSARPLSPGERHAVLRRPAALVRLQRVPCCCVTSGWVSRRIREVLDGHDDAPAALRPRTSNCWTTSGGNLRGTSGGAQRPARNGKGEGTHGRRSLRRFRSHAVPRRGDRAGGARTRSATATAGGAAWPRTNVADGSTGPSNCPRTRYRAARPGWTRVRPRGPESSLVVTLSGCPRSPGTPGSAAAEGISREYVLGLADMYVADERFAATSRRARRCRVRSRHAAPIRVSEEASGQLRWSRTEPARS